jgi:hypothetical protein
MRRITLTIATVAMGLATAASGLYAQVPAPPQPGGAPGQPNPNLNQPGPQGEQAPGAPGAGFGFAGGMAQQNQQPVARPIPPRPVRPSYSMYGGPVEQESLGQYPQRRGVRTPSMSPLYKIPGLPDQIAEEDAARQARRDAAVEFGMYRNQFLASSRFWMDHDRTRLAKVRYAMDEAMWHGIHPAYDWGDGGYMYNTAASVGGPQMPGTGERVIINPPQASPTVRHEFAVRTKDDMPTAPMYRTNTESGSLVASDR